MRNPDASASASLRQIARIGQSVITPVLFVLVLLGAWYGVIWLLALPPYLMPTPAAAAGAFLRERWLILDNVVYTLGETVVGLAIGATSAIATAGLSVAIPAVGRAILPFAVALRSTPVVAVAPLITLLVGRGFRTGTIVVVIASFFPILVNVVRGLASTTSSHRELMHVLAATRWQVFRYVRVPFALPHIFAGLRTAAPVAVLGAMLAEWLTGTRGVGYLILDAAATREQELLWAAICVSMALALTVFWTTTGLEQRLTRRLG